MTKNYYSVSLIYLIIAISQLFFTSHLCPPFKAVTYCWNSYKQLPYSDT